MFTKVPTNMFYLVFIFLIFNLPTTVFKYNQVLHVQCIYTLHNVQFLILLVTHILKIISI